MRMNLLGDPVGPVQGGKGWEVLGCNGCPLNHAPGIRKVKGLERLKGRKAMMWAMCPGPVENRRGLELVGPTSQLLWDTIKPLGLTRGMFDIQNVVRCMPTEDNSGVHFRDPSKKELRCCSVYNEQALYRNGGRAVVYVLLGEVAASQLLGNSVDRERPVFWYEPWEAYVVLNHHPSYISRIGGKTAGPEYLTWRDRFRAVAEILKRPGRWGFVKAQNYTVVRTLAQFDEMEKCLRQEAKQNRRISLDIEDDTSNGKRSLLMLGFGTGHYRQPKVLSSWNGRCFSVVLDHPQAGYEPAHLEAMRQRARKLVEEGMLKKSLQNGSYDGDALLQTLGAKLRGYDYDTQYGTFLCYSSLRSCSLENLTYRFFPEFCDYKDVVAEWSGHFKDAPIDRLALRNSGDCDITQRLEQRFGHRVRQPLVEVYIGAGRSLAKMERRGPLLDVPNWKKAAEILPQMISKLDRQLELITGIEHFDADSPQQVAHYIYDVLKLPETEAGRTTVKTVLEYLQATTDNKALGVINKRRAIGKMMNTYIKGFQRSAEVNQGELHTVWWLTGTVTGRLRSGKGDRGEAEGVINMQNLSNNPLLQNLVCSDPDWRKALEE